MYLDRITVTGADDSVEQRGLIELSKSFPFIEYGILISASHMGTPRFPSVQWIGHLQNLAPDQVQLSLHICGKWTRDLLIGINNIPSTLFDRFQRIQLNFHAEKTACLPIDFHRALSNLIRRQFIFQFDGAMGNKYFDEIDKIGGIDCVPLFDASGGTGISPNRWPKPKILNGDSTLRYHGYAGGLGPENLEQQLISIAAAAGDCRIWIDMETKIRSDNGNRFDLDKVRQCLEICASQIK